MIKKIITSGLVVCLVIFQIVPAGYSADITIDPDTHTPVQSLESASEQSSARSQTADQPTDFFANEQPLSAATTPPTSDQIIQQHRDQVNQAIDSVSVTEALSDLGPVEKKLKETIAALQAIMKSLTDALGAKGDDANSIKKAEDDLNRDAGDRMKSLYGQILSVGKIIVNSVDGMIAGVVGLATDATQTSVYQNLKIDLKDKRSIAKVDDLLLNAIEETSPVLAGLAKRNESQLLSDGRRVVYESAGPIPANADDSFWELALAGGVAWTGTLKVLSQDGHVESEHQIPRAFDDLDHDEIRLEQGEIRIYRFYKSNSTPDIFSQDGLKLALNAQGCVQYAEIVRSSFDQDENGNRVSMYYKIGDINYQYVQLNGQTITRPTAGSISLGGAGRLTVLYDSAGNLTGYEYRDGLNKLLLSATRKADGFFEVTHLASGVKFENVQLSQVGEAFKLFRELNQYVLDLQVSKARIASAIQLLEGIDVSGEVIIPTTVTKLILSAQDLDYSLARGVGAQAEKYQLSRCEVSPYAIGSCSNNVIISPDGAQLVFDNTSPVRVRGTNPPTFTEQNLRLIEQRFPGQNGRREFFYDYSGKYISYSFTSPTGARTYYAQQTRFQESGRLLAETVNGETLFYVGYSDKGFSNVADAVYLAKDGDIVSLKEGATIREPIQFGIYKSITIRGSGAGAVIDGNGKGVMFAAVYGGDVRFENLTFRNFNFSYLGAAEQLIRVQEKAKLTLDHVVFENNTGGRPYYANLVSVDSGHLRLDNVTCRNNQLGEGACVSFYSGFSSISSQAGTLRVSNSVFENNRTYGGAAAIRVSGMSYAYRLALGFTPPALLSDMPIDPDTNQRYEVVIEDSVFRNNTNDYKYTYEGAVRISDLKALVSHVDFLNTTGTALSLRGSSARVEHSLFKGNTDFYYSAIHSAPSGGSSSQLVLDHNTFVGNMVTSPASVQHGVIGIVGEVFNKIPANQNAAMRANIFSGNYIGVLVEAGAILTVADTLSDFETFAGVGNMRGSAAFFNAQGGEYQLLRSSAAQTNGIAWGSEGFVTAEQVALVGAARKIRIDGIEQRISIMRQSIVNANNGMADLTARLNAANEESAMNAGVITNDVEAHIARFNELKTRSGLSQEMLELIQSMLDGLTELNQQTQDGSLAVQTENNGKKIGYVATVAGFNDVIDAWIANTAEPILARLRSAETIAAVNAVAMPQWNQVPYLMSAPQFDVYAPEYPTDSLANAGQVEQQVLDALSLALEQARDQKIEQVRGVIDQLNAVRAEAQAINAAVAGDKSAADALSSSNKSNLQSSISAVQSRLSALQNNPDLPFSMRSSITGTIQSLNAAIQSINQDYQQLAQVNSSRSGAWPAAYNAFLSDINSRVAQLNNPQVMGKLQSAKTLAELNAVIIPNVSVPQAPVKPQFEIYYLDRQSAVNAVTARTTAEAREQEALNAIALNQARNQKIAAADQALMTLNQRLSAIALLQSETGTLSVARAAVNGAEVTAQMTDLAAYLTNAQVTDVQKASVQTILNSWNALKTTGNDFDGKVSALTAEKTAIENLIAEIESYKTQLQGATTLAALNALILPAATIEQTSFDASYFQGKFETLEGLKTQAAALKNEIENHLRPVLPISVLSIPKNAEAGGVDANVLDWSAAGSTAYRVYRRVFGTDNWTLIGQTSPGALRYIDTTIDSNHAYQYEARPLDESNAEQPAIAISQSANYHAAYDGLKPKNVLVLMSMNDLGYVNIADEVEGYQTSNGKLDPLTEADLLRYLGLNQSAWRDSDGDGVFVISEWNVIKKSDGTIEVPLGVYYGMRRDIPLTNLMFLSGVPTAERAGVGNFQQLVIDPIRAHMSAKGITDRITSVMSVFRFPIVGASGQSWEYTMTQELRKSFVASGHIPMSDGNDFYYDAGRPISRQLGDSYFVATRLDAQDVRTTRRMIDDSIWAEQNYHFDNPDWIKNESSLRAYFDYQGAYYYYDPNFKLAAEYALQSGYFSKPGDIACDASKSACSLQNLMMAPDFKNLTVPQNTLSREFGQFKLDQLVADEILRIEWGALHLNQPVDVVKSWVENHYPNEAPFVLNYLQDIYPNTDFVKTPLITVKEALGSFATNQLISSGALISSINGLRLNQNFETAQDWIEAHYPGEASQIVALLKQINPVFMQAQYDQNSNGRLDNAFLRIGWYEWLQFQDYYDFARGAIAWNLDSSNGTQMRQRPDFLRFALLTSQDIPTNTTADALWAQVQSHLSGQVQAVGVDALENINNALKDVQLFEKWKSLQTSASRITDVSTDQKLRNLLQEIEFYKDKNYEQLTEIQKAAIVTLNTLLLFHYEMNYDYTTLIHRQYGWNGIADQWWSAGFINDLYASDGRSLKRGAVATIAAIDEPGLSGVDKPDDYTYYLMHGYSFGELASGKANRSVSMMAYNGDALYRPYPFINDRQEILHDSKGEVIGRRVYLEQRLEYSQDAQHIAPAAFNAYREYDLNGRLVKEQLSATKSIVYLENGMAAVNETVAAPAWANLSLGSRYEENKVTVYAQDGTLVVQAQLPAIYAGLERYEAVLNQSGVIEFHLIYKDSGNVKVFNQAGELIRIDLAAAASNKILLGPLATSSAVEELELIGETAIYRSAKLGEFLGVRKEDGSIEFNLPKTTTISARKLIVRLSQMQGGLGYFLGDYKLEKLNDAGQVTEFKAQQLDSHGYILTSEEDNSVEYRKTTCSGIVGFKSGVALCSASALQYKTKPVGSEASVQFNEEYKEYDAAGTVVKNLMVAHHVNFPAGRADFYYVTFSERLPDGKQSVRAAYSETENYLEAVSSLSDSALLQANGKFQTRQIMQTGEYGMMAFQEESLWKNGHWQPYLIMRLTEDYEYEYFIVRGAADAPVGSGDDIRVGSDIWAEQEVNGYTVAWQLHSISWGVDGHLSPLPQGLNFWKGSTNTFVEHPAVSIVRLDGIDYQINVDSQGVIRLDAVATQALPASFSEALKVSPVFDFRLQRDTEQRKVRLVWEQEAGKKYEIQISTTPDFSANVQIIKVDGSEYDASKPAENTTNYYRIRSVSGSGIASDWSDSLTVDTTLFAFEDVMSALSPS